MGCALTLALPCQATDAVELERVTSRPKTPMFVTHSGDGSGRLFVGERRGRIRINTGSGLRPVPFLDIMDRVKCCAGETGLMSIAFHPDYTSNGFFYVSYIDANDDSVVSRFTVTENPEVADPDSEAVILRIEQPGPFHNVGHIAFGPDGFLYIGSGDGDDGGDLDDNGQSLATLLGKLLRIDVDTAFPYAIPADNPFVGTAGAQPEIWAYGLRNPWRFSFDRETGDLLIGDVGEKSFEEVNFQSANSGGGENYGWRLKEADACFQPSQNCDPGGLTAPVLVYGHDDPESPCFSVTGGYVYRGPSTFSLPGLYVFGDFCSGKIFGARRNAADNWLMFQLADTEFPLVSFGEDDLGQLLAVDLAGSIWRIDGKAIFSSDFESKRPQDWSRRRGGLKNEKGGLDGSERALEVPLNQGERARFLRSLEPEGLGTFTVSFDLSANRADLDLDSVEILRLVGPGSPLELRLEERKKGKYRVRLFASGNQGPKRLVGTARIPKRRPVRLEIQWMKATAPGRSDGEVFLLRDGRVQAFLTDLDSDQLSVDSVQLGLPSGAPQAASGSFLIDNYVSTP